MTQLLYYLDSGLMEFEAQVVDVTATMVKLDRTAFYPGGGGQSPDRGWIDGKEVVSVRKQGEDVWHETSTKDLKKGRMVKCVVDGEHRERTSCGHTAQHLLAGCLIELDPALSVEKVSIGAQVCTVVMNGTVGYDVLSSALARTNLLISQAWVVEASVYDRESARRLNEVRVKWNKLPTDDVRIVRIGSVDASACTGVHAANTRAIKAMAITSMHVRGGTTVIHFLTGPEAIAELSRTNIRVLDLASRLDTSAEKASSILETRLSGYARMERLVHDLNEPVFQALEPCSLNGIAFFSGSFQGVGRSWLSARASDLANRHERCVIVLAALDPGGGAQFVAHASSSTGIHIGNLVRPILSELRGNGGGGPLHAGGGAKDWGQKEVRTFIEHLQNKLERYPVKAT